MSEMKNEHELIEDIERDDAIVGVAMKWSLAVLLLLLVMAGILFAMLRPAEITPVVEETELAKVNVRQTETVTVPSVSFVDITDEAGIDFVHTNGARGEKLLPETMGGGGGFFDFDNDGDADLLLVNSQEWPASDQSETEPAISALYENDGTGRFTNITEGSGFDISIYGMGVAFGDYDNDGLVDVYLTAVGPNKLFHNDGNGKFTDVTETTGTAGNPEDWGTSAGWFDYDRDGDLDLYVGNYVVWSREFDLAQNFQLTGGDRAYGRPQNFEGVFPYLFRNDGSGNFADVTAESGLQVRNPATNVPLAKSLGVTFADFDQDGWLDIVVANDTVQNLLFHNQKDGTFQEMGAIAGVAFDMNGAARGAMGIDAAHFRNDDSIGLAIGNFSNEMTALYVTRRNDLQFVDEAISSGLGPNTRLELTFGVFFFDFDLDGRFDLFASNGHLEEDINRVQPSQHYEQPPQLFWNCGSTAETEFLPVPSTDATSDFHRPMVGRGSAYADIDGDGDQDILIMATGQKPRLLRNDQQLSHHWLRFSLEGTTSNRDAIGAEVIVDTEDRLLRAQVMPTCGYLSQMELPVTFGLGNADSVESVRIVWPDGSEQTLDDIGVDQQHQVKQQSAANSQAAE